MMTELQSSLNTQTIIKIVSIGIKHVYKVVEGEEDPDEAIENAIKELFENIEEN